MKALSVIIPVYNNADHLEKTLRSVKEQSFADFEVILVDDGSSDESAAIMRAFADTDDRFIFIHQENQGVAAARNRGLERAEGRFVTFVDADDIIPKDAFLHMHQITLVEDCDTVAGIYERVDGISSYVNARSKQLAEKKTIVTADDPDILHSWSLCNKWFSNEIIQKNQLRLESYRHLEDAVFLYRYLAYAKCVATCPHVIYTYRKPLPFVARTTTQSPEKTLLESAEAAFMRVKELTESFGESFYHELVYRYLYVLTGDYYRRLWALDDDCYQLLQKRIPEYLALLDEMHKERFLRDNSDLFRNGTLRSREDIVKAPELTIAICGIGQQYVNLLLSGLYDHSYVSFQVVADERYRGVIDAVWTEMANFSFASVPNPETFLANALSPFAAVIDTDMIYDHRSLTTMVNALKKDETLESVSLCPREMAENETTVTKDWCKYTYTEYQAEADVFLANKLFRTNAQTMRKDSFTAVSHRAMKKPAMVDLTSVEALYQKAAEVLGKCWKQYKRNSSSHIPGLAIAKKVYRKLRKKPVPKKAIIDFYMDEEIVPNRVIFEGLGKIPRGSMLYLLKEITAEEREAYEIYFSVTQASETDTKRILHEHGIEGVKTVVAGSERYKEVLFSAEYLFNEVDFPNWWIKKPGQIYTNIWHGTPLKKLGKAKPGIIHRDANAARNFTMADYLLFPSDYAKEHILADCDVEPLAGGKEVMVGYPRTGQLFDTKMRETVRRQCAEYPDQQIVVWMPTWNEYTTKEEILAFLTEMDAGLMDDQLLFVNLHHKTGITLDYQSYKRIRPFPAEWDTYEFLCGADVLITDYSSVFFDFAVTGRKIILYCPDQRRYEQERGLYIPLDKLPFPLPETTAQLLDALVEEKAYDDGAFMEAFCKYDSIDNAKNLLDVVLKGNETKVPVRKINPVRTPVTFLVTDGMEDTKASRLLHELAERGSWTADCYLSFTEDGMDQHAKEAETLLRMVPIYATKGKPLDIRSEQKRLFNAIPVRSLIVLDSCDAKRIMSFARANEPAYLFISQMLCQKLADGDEELKKAVQTFGKYGDGIYSLYDEAVTEEVAELTGKKVCRITSTDAFADRFLLR